MTFQLKMAFKFLFICFMFLIHLSKSSVVDDLSCANHVHHECKQCEFSGISLAKGDRKLFCEKLKACAKCLSVPRCSSEYLQRFIDLLITTIQISHNHCPKIKFSKLLQLQEDMCKGVQNGHRMDECGHQCICENGTAIDCVRIRKEFTTMTFDERRRFVNVYYKATTDPHYRGEFAQILNKHAEIPSNFLHHMPNIFFPWHRWHLLQIENFLRRIDCRVTLPYYDWSIRSSEGTVWRTTDPTDVWNAGPQGIGGNGVGPSHCVADGKFKKGKWSMPNFKGGKCLKRNFDFKCNLTTAEKVKSLLKKSFKYFENYSRETMHAMFHDCIGGNMPDNAIASFAPEFIFHHAFMDKLWSQFQKRGDKYKYAYYPSINFRMPFADLFPFQLLTNEKLPGEVSVEYEEMKLYMVKEKVKGDDEEEQEEEEEEDIPAKKTEINEYGDDIEFE